MLSWIYVGSEHLNLGPHLHGKCLSTVASPLYFIFYMYTFTEAESYVGQAGLDLTV